MPWLAAWSTLIRPARSRLPGLPFPFRLGVALLAVSTTACAQSADWREVVWREPQVRYLLADMTLGGNVAMYRNYATRAKDPDSREAIRLWEGGTRVVNTNDFERRWVPNRFSE